MNEQECYIFLFKLANYVWHIANNESHSLSFRAESEAQYIALKSVIDDMDLTDKYYAYCKEIENGEI